MSCAYHANRPVDLASYRRRLAIDCMRRYDAKVPFAEWLVTRIRRVMKRKNMLMDQRKLTAAKAALGAETETAAVDAALDLVVFRTEVFRGLDALVAAGGVERIAPTRRAARRAG